MIINMVSLKIKEYSFIFKDQKLPGILRDKTMADEMMYIFYDYTQNYPICRLQLVVETL